MAPKKSEKAPSKPSRGDVVTRERRISGLLSVAGVLVLIAMYYAYELLVVPRLGLTNLHLHSLQDRLTYAIRLQLPGLLILLLSVLHVASVRAVGGPKLSPNDSYLNLAVKILTNSVEQFILSAGSQLVLATYLPEDRLKILPLIAATFVVGRLTFMTGYLIGPHLRSFGFVVTFIPTFGALGYSSYFMLTTGLVSRLSAPSIRS